MASSSSDAKEAAWAAMASSSMLTDKLSMTVAALSGSKVATCGTALTLAGFFGTFGAVSLTPQNGIISAYVLFFGLVLLAAAFGHRADLLAKYFGFLTRENGQLWFLLFAGNLAWTTGWMGFLAALFCNFIAIGCFMNAPPDERPSWAGGGSASGMVDLQADEML